MKRTQKVGKKSRVVKAPLSFNSRCKRSGLGPKRENVTLRALIRGLAHHLLFLFIDKIHAWVHIAWQERLGLFLCPSEALDGKTVRFSLTPLRCQKFALWTDTAVCLVHELWPGAETPRIHSRHSSDEPPRSPLNSRGPAR